MKAPMILSSLAKHNLAKVGVERSNRFTRSILPSGPKPRFAGAFVFLTRLKSRGADAARRGAGHHRVTRVRI